MNNEYKSFSEFYPFYLSQHSNLICRRLHFVGSSMVLLIFFYIFYTGSWLLILLLPLVGYGFAWLGHFFFEKNRPATFNLEKAVEREIIVQDIGFTVLSKNFSFTHRLSGHFLEVLWNQ